MKGNNLILAVTTFAILFGQLAALSIIDGDEYNVQLWVKNSQGNLGRALHPFNSFSFNNGTIAQSGGAMTYSTTHAKLWKTDLYWFETNIQRNILQITLFTDDQSDILANPVPLARDNFDQWTYGQDLWFFVGYNGINTTEANGLSFNMTNNGYATVERVEIIAEANGSRIKKQEMFSRFQNVPNLGAVYYLEDVDQLGINSITIRFTILPNEFVEPPPPVVATTGRPVQSFCETLSQSCGLCTSHPRCVWCQASDGQTGRCVLNDTTFRAECTADQGVLLSPLCMITDPTIVEPPTPTFPVENYDDPSTITEDPYDTAKKARITKIVAISVTVATFTIFALFIAGAVIMYKKGVFRRKVNNPPVELQTTTIQQ